MRIHISVAQQQLSLYADDGSLLRRYPVSTAKAGVGECCGSFQTPRGRHLIRAKIGDTVRFVAVDKGHNAETVPGMLPDGAESLAGKPNEEIILTLDAEGVYGIRCKPHYGLGMVALIIAGEPVNLQAAEKVKAPGKAGKLFKELFAEAEK